MVLITKMEVGIICNLKAFYAYSSHKPDLLEDIKGAVNLINESQSIAITTWEDLAIGGKYIINGIFNQFSTDFFNT